MIGINDYKLVRPLKNAVNDAKAMKRLLEEKGVKVFYKTNCTLAEFNSIRDKFLADVNRGDAAIFFFAGHGCTYNNSPRMLMITESETYSLKRDSLNLHSLLAK